MLFIKLNFLCVKIVKKIVLKKTVRKNKIIENIISLSLPILIIERKG
jgi:hypothetical protein